MIGGHAENAQSPHVWGSQHRRCCSQGNWRGRGQRRTAGAERTVADGVRPLGRRAQGRRVHRARADWCSAVKCITGLEVNERSRAAAGLILIRTGRGTYALSYGVGQHMLDPYSRDDEFGLEFATRCLDDDRIIKIRDQIMDGSPRPGRDD
ncbi:DUF6119 family protein [Streptomyces sp. AK04-3B]|uniref:DUF6119 family protein n=1 Tax=Streptomyces sp. AK04-3B TaxID=3028650 RepID=UPI0029C0C536|nr:DUF6119 family protein [Streptomyces sp. AK04-3B]